MDARVCAARRDEESVIGFKVIFCIFISALDLSRTPAEESREPTVVGSLSLFRLPFEETLPDQMGPVSPILIGNYERRRLFLR